MLHFSVLRYTFAAWLDFLAGFNCLYRQVVIYLLVEILR